MELTVQNESYLKSARESAISQVMCVTVRS